MKQLFKLLFGLALILAPSLGQAQNGYFTDRAVGVFPLVGQGGHTALTPISYGQVRICTSADIGTTTTPCPHVASISDANGNPLNIVGGNFGQLTTDVVGRFSFQANSGNYQVQVAASSSNTPQLNYSITIGFSALTTSFLSGTSIFTGNVFFGSGLPWFDVMAFGAKNDGVTNDAPAINAAMTAACALSPPGGVIYFPRGAGYKITNTGTTPFTIPCNNLSWKGAAFGSVDVPAPSSAILANSLTVPLIVASSTSCGFKIEDFYLQGNLASAGAIAISGTASGTCQATVKEVFFDQWGGPCILTNTVTSTWFIEDNWAQNCLGQKAGLVADTGAFDLGNNDLELHHNFVSASAGLSAGGIGTGHAYGIVVRGTGGFVTSNMAEISQHGWLIAGNFLTVSGNRALLNQGTGFHITGTENVITGNKSLTNSQTANNGFDGFLCDGLCSGNLFSDNEVDDTAGGNGNHTKNGFTDANSNGPLNETTRNKYVNNRLGSLALGTLYNFTGINFPAVTSPHVMSGDRGDNSVTIQCSIDAETQYFATALTNNRTFTFSTVGAYQGCHFKIIRTLGATTNFTLSAVSCTTCSTLMPGMWLEVEFFNGSFGMTAFGAVGGATLISEGTCPAGLAAVDMLCGDTTTHTISHNSNVSGLSSMTGTWQCTNVTPVTVNANVATDQNAMACTIPAGTLNRALRSVRVWAAGVYSTPAASASQMTVKMKLCTVSGCGSGIVITPINIQTTALGGIQVTNENWSVEARLTTQTAGASSAYESHGDLLIDLTNALGGADSSFGDTNNATVGTIDNTAQLFLQITFSFSVASASNTATQRQLIVETIN